mgnify:CR=1 FL=1
MHALIMDDHEFVTTGLRTTLNEYFSDLEVSAANCSEDALRILTVSYTHLTLPTTD